MSSTSPSEPRALAVLAVQRGPGAGGELLVRQPVVSIGKGAQNDVVIEDDSVSTSHAQLEYERGAWRIMDLNSTNGTFVEGVRLAPEVPTPLTFGSTVRFGAVQTHFRPVPEADPESARAAYRPPQDSARTARGSGGFRLPLWVLVLVIVLLALIALWIGMGRAPVAEPVAPAGSALVAPARYLPDAA